jgi:hypothetical protein
LGIIREWFLFFKLSTCQKKTKLISGALCLHLCTVGERVNKCPLVITIRVLVPSSWSQYCVLVPSLWSQYRVLHGHNTVFWVHLHGHNTMFWFHLHGHNTVFWFHLHGSQYVLWFIFDLKYGCRGILQRHILERNVLSFLMGYPIVIAQVAFHQFLVLEPIEERHTEDDDD